MPSDQPTTVPSESLQTSDKPAKFRRKYSSSRIRDHLANERTYLAWMRTAVGLMGFGVVILRLRAFHPPLVPRPGYGWKLGLTFSIVGLLTVLLSTQHYFAVRWSIDEDNYEPPDRWVILFSLAVILLGSGILYFVFASSINPAELMVFEDFAG
jgi:putative membrane protein